MSNVKQFIPESVKQTWHEWRAAVKGVEKEELGDNHISEDVEMVGWGVEQAQQRHKADASKLEHSFFNSAIPIRSWGLTFGSTSSQWKPH